MGRGLNALHFRLNYAARDDCSRQSVAEQVRPVNYWIYPEKMVFCLKNETSISSK